MPRWVRVRVALAIGCVVLGLHFAGVAAEPAVSVRDIEMMLIWTGDLDAEAGRVPQSERLEAVRKFRGRTASRSVGPLTTQEIAVLARDSVAERERVGFRPVNDERTGVTVFLPTRLIDDGAPTADGSNRTEWRDSRDGFVVRVIKLMNRESDLSRFYENMRKLEAEGRTFKWPPPGTTVTPSDTALTMEGTYGNRSFHIHGRREGDQARILQISYPTEKAMAYLRIANAMMSTFEPFPSSVSNPSQPQSRVAGWSMANDATVTPTTRNPLAEKRDAIESGRRKAAKRVALIIGNGLYQSGSVLKNPENDAREIKDILEALGFEVVSGNHLSKRTMEIAIQEFRKKLEGADVGLFFYSGHGIQIGGQNFVIPVDARLEDEDDVDLNAIGLDTILRQMSAKVPVSLVFLDACRDNPFARTLATRAARSFTQRPMLVERGFSFLQSGAGMFIAFSTAPDRVAADAPELKNSPFTTALKRHLPVRGQTIEDLMSAVRTEVMQATGGRQVPWHSSALTERFVFSPLVSVEQ